MAQCPWGAPARRRRLPAIDASNTDRFARVIEARLGDLTEAQQRRVRAVMRRIRGASGRG